MTEETPASNVKNITRLQDQISRQEDADVKFHMTAWVDEYVADDDEYPPEWLPKDFCGTCACIRGQIDLLEGMNAKDAENKAMSWETDDYIREGADFLGVGMDVARLLFIPWDTTGLTTLDEADAVSPDDAIAALEVLKTNPTYEGLLEHWHSLVG